MFLMDSQQTFNIVHTDFGFLGTIKSVSSEICILKELEYKSISVADSVAGPQLAFLGVALCIGCSRPQHITIPSHQLRHFDSPPCCIRDTAYGINKYEVQVL